MSLIKVWLMRGLICIKVVAMGDESWWTCSVIDNEDVWNF